ncbi:MAG TPA: GPW/gp25 family protein [Roseomonas sp.]|nr:GPW/gp25 family protein [Roseomonas sp.]
MTGPSLLAQAKPILPPEPIGWPLLPLPSADGVLRFPTLVESVRQMIEVILRTTPGEQLMRAEFGAGLEAMLHEPNTLATRSRMQERIAEGLAAWEPRILVDRIDVEPGPDLREVRITIAYRLRRTGEGGQIVAALPLGGG